MDLGQGVGLSPGGTGVTVVSGLGIRLVSRQRGMDRGEGGAQRSSP